MIRQLVFLGMHYFSIIVMYGYVYVCIYLFTYVILLCVNNNNNNNRILYVICCIEITVLYSCVKIRIILRTSAPYGVINSLHVSYILHIISYSVCM